MKNEITLVFSCFSAAIEWVRSNRQFDALHVMVGMHWGKDGTYSMIFVPK